MKLSQKQKELYKSIVIPAEMGEKTFLPHHQTSNKQVILQARSVLNVLKQEWCAELTNRLFLNIFPRMDITKSLVHNKELKKDPYFRNTLKLYELHIPQRIVIDRLVKTGLLPENFYDLK